MNQMTLVEAARAGELESVADILARRAGSLAPEELNDALCQAAFNGHAEIIRLLLQHGADVNARLANDLAPLDCAVENMHGDIVRLLLSAGANINSRDSSGVTALHRALDIEVEHSNYKYDMEGVLIPPSTSITEILVEHGADLNVVDNKGATPLQWATTLRHEAGEKLLRARGAVRSSPGS